MSKKNFSSVKKFTGKYDSFTEGGLRHLIFNRETNGFKKAFIHLGRRVLIDEDAFFEILLNGQGDK